jgi:hypothetical protein
VDLIGEGLVDEEDQGVEAKWDRPPPDNFVMAHPTWTMGVYLLDCTESEGFDATYILGREAAQRIIDAEHEVTAVEVFLLGVRGGGWVFWGIKLGSPQSPKSSSDDYLKSARAAIAAARARYVKITWQNRPVMAAKTRRGYRTRAIKVEGIPAPDWPKDPRALFLETIEERYIRNPEDDKILKYLGEK